MIIILKYNLHDHILELYTKYFEKASSDGFYFVSISWIKEWER